MKYRVTTTCNFVKFSIGVTVQDKKQFTVAELASLANVSRVTLYRYLKQGNLSFQTDAAGNKIIEASEAYRWLASHGVTSATTSTTSVKQPDASKDSSHLQREISLLRELLQAKDAVIEEQKQRLLLLEDNRQQDKKDLVNRQEIQSEPIPTEPLNELKNRARRPRSLLDRLASGVGEFLK